VCATGLAIRRGAPVSPQRWAVRAETVFQGFKEDQAIMSNTTIKHRILKAIEELPPDTTFEDVMERLYFLYKIDKGLKQVEAGETMSHEEAMERTKTWHA
jgi:predicted transcriptional regulator